MKIAALIPARAGSKRIPGKNLKKLDELPLVAWSIATARALELEAYVSSDSAIIRETAEKFGAIGLERPASLAGDTSTDLQVVKHFLQVVPKVDVVVYLRPTTPIRATEKVQGAIDLMLESLESCTGLRSVHRMVESCFKNFTMIHGLLRPVTQHDGVVHSDTPDQLVPATYKANGYVDLALRSTVEAGSLWGDTVIGYETNPVAEVDTPADWDWLEYQVKLHRTSEVHEFHREGGAKNPPFGS